MQRRKIIIAKNWTAAVVMWGVLCGVCRVRNFLLQLRWGFESAPLGPLSPRHVPAQPGPRVRGKEKRISTRSDCATWPRACGGSRTPLSSARRHRLWHCAPPGSASPPPRSWWCDRSRWPGTRCWCRAGGRWGCRRWKTRWRLGSKCTSSRGFSSWRCAFCRSRRSPWRKDLGPPKKKGRQANDTVLSYTMSGRRGFCCPSPWCPLSHPVGSLVVAH